jgi:hypothetical protein
VEACVGSRIASPGAAAPSIVTVLNTALSSLLIIKRCTGGQDKCGTDQGGD